MEGRCGMRDAGDGKRTKDGTRIVGPGGYGPKATKRRNADVRDAIGGFG